MDAILASGKFTAAEIRCLNYCRLYLKAHTISDLSDVSGQYLDPTKVTGHMSDETSSKTHEVQINQD